ncbi:hypothetical protein [Streptomyces sp. NBC_00572]|uniref:hypothetical protein n=1 Tax=Streptomyces sp. NBC_00572 TaxID=2903664 RepID=UPI00225A3EFC|nr:hypothetical protein [Streptomyces sp. NBC_00572]MCX4985557.1 hypothetical protein [Streptomyces sp. NBC_00572]
MPHPSPAAPPPDRRPGEPDPPGQSDPFAGSDRSPRLVRLGAPRPGPAARRAHRFGVPLVPLLVAALVATAFLAARGGTEQGLSTAGGPGGDAVGVPSPVVTGDGRPETTPPGGASADTRRGDTGAAGTRTADTPTAGTPTGDVTSGGTPSRSESPRRSAPPGEATSASPSGAESTTTRPRPTGSAAGGGGSSRPVSFEELRAGDCFDVDRDAPGTAVRRSCDTPHNAELVARLRLTGLHATDTAIREAATLLCREPLRRKAARQPLGTRWTTFVQYPYRTSYLLGSDTVACSLVAPSAGGGTLSHPLH